MFGPSAHYKYVTEKLLSPTSYYVMIIIGHVYVDKSGCCDDWTS